MFFLPGYIVYHPSCLKYLPVNVNRMFHFWKLYTWNWESVLIFYWKVF